MTLEPYAHLLEVEQVGEVTVVRFKRRTILEGEAIEAIGKHLLELAQQEDRLAFVLNFSGVESLTSGLLGRFMALYNMLDDVGGRLVFCRVDAFLMQIFKVVRMPELIAIYPDEAQAVEAVRPKS
jgi:anti-anti-sigma factor